MVTEREKHFGDGWKTCPECGHQFFVGDVECWVYKRYVSVDGNSHLRYFCKWSCLRKFDQRYEENKKKKRSETATLAHKKRKEQKRERFG